MFDLQKETEKVSFILKKKGVPSITAEVVAILDVSGSTKELYRRGTMQQALQRIVPVVLNFDDNGDLPVYVFNDGDDYSNTRNDLTKDNYSDFVSRNILEDSNLTLWGGTAYAPVLHAALADLGFYHAAKHGEAKSFFKRMFGSDDQIAAAQGFLRQSTSKLPAVIYMLTDGENETSDQGPCRRLLDAAATAKSEVYFNFIGVGNASFNFLKSIGDDFPNTGFAQIADIERTANTDDIYEYLLPTELAEWLKLSAAAQTVSAGQR